MTSEIYALTRGDQFSRDFGLRDQITRASASVMHNIAEGFDAGSHKEFSRFLRYAQRSCSEVQSQLYVALDQRYITRDQFETTYKQARHTKNKIGAFIRYLVNNP